MRILATQINYYDSDLYNLIFPYISEERQYRLKKYFFAEDQIRLLVGELFLRISAIYYWGIDNKAICFNYNEYGKPQFQNFSDFHFNISYSDQWVVIVLDHSPVGIDIEQVRPIDLALADYFFTEKEIHQLFMQPIEYRINYFYKLWTLKESYIKAVGKGLSIPLQSFSFDLSFENINFQTNLEDDIEWSFKQYQLHSNYEMAVSSTHKDFPEKIQIVPLLSLINKIKLIE